MRKSSIALVAAAFVLALAASLYMFPALAHPYWADEETAEEEFVPPCWGDERLTPPWWDGEEYNGTYGYPPEWCPWWNSTDGQPPEWFHPPWRDPDGGSVVAPPQGLRPWQRRWHDVEPRWYRSGRLRSGQGRKRLPKGMLLEP